jgi:hypothetical protein
MQPFESDGCTGFPDGKHLDCCIQHDIDYASGMSIETADLRLFECVNDESGFIIAAIMFIGLLIFGPMYRKIKGIKNDRT